MKALRFAHPLVLTLAVGACSEKLPAAPSRATPSTFLSFTSESGEYVGAGQVVSVTPETAAFTAVVGCNDSQIEVRVRGAGNTWDLHIAGPAAARLSPGAYVTYTDWPRQGPLGAGLTFYGNGRSCAGSTGRFDVKEALYAPDGTAERFHATFEQRCVNKTPTLRGEIRLERAPVHAQPFLVCR